MSDTDTGNPTISLPPPHRFFAGSPGMIQKWAPIYETVQVEPTVRAVHLRVVTPEGGHSLLFDAVCARHLAASLLAAATAIEAPRVEEYPMPARPEGGGHDH